MKKIAIPLILLIIAEILTGCRGKIPDKLGGLLDDTSDSQGAVAAVKSSTASQEAETASLPAPAANQGINYYPDAGLPTVDSDATVVLTDKLKMKLYLVEKYKPGLCFGEPAAVSPENIASYLQENAAMAQFVGEYYKTDSELEIYSKVKQIEGINLIRGQEGRYLYRFVDGQCRDLTIYEGEISIINVTIFESLLNHNIKKTPC